MSYPFLKAGSKWELRNRGLNSWKLYQYSCYSVSAVQFGLGTFCSHLLSPLAVSCLWSPRSATEEWWRKCTFIVLHFLYSCIIGDPNFKIHIQKMHSCISDSNGQLWLDLRSHWVLKGNSCRVSFGARTTQARGWEGDLQPQAERPISLTWVLLAETAPSYVNAAVPGPVLCSLPCPRRARGWRPWPNVRDLVLEVSGLNAELGLSLCFTYINPEVLNIFSGFGQFYKKYTFREKLLPLLKKKKKTTLRWTICVTQLYSEINNLSHTYWFSDI